TVIHRDVRLAESPSAGESVLTYAPRSRGAADYRALASEIFTGTARIEEVADSRVRRGIQKRLSTLFEGVWIPKAARGGSADSIEST
ncbi:MAG: ParA family protein, partial [Planctomycetota bacterium]